MNNKTYLSRSTFFNCVSEPSESKSLYMGDGTESLRRHKYINHRFFADSSSDTSELELKLADSVLVSANWLTKASVLIRVK